MEENLEKQSLQVIWDRLTVAKSKTKAELMLTALQKIVSVSPHLQEKETKSKEFEVSEESSTSKEVLTENVLQTLNVSLRKAGGSNE